MRPCLRWRCAHSLASDVAQAYPTTILCPSLPHLPQSLFALPSEFFCFLLFSCCGWRAASPQVTPLTNKYLALTWLPIGSRTGKGAVKQRGGDADSWSQDGGGADDACAGDDTLLAQPPRRRRTSSAARLGAAAMGLLRGPRGAARPQHRPPAEHLNSSSGARQFLPARIRVMLCGAAPIASRGAARRRQLGINPAS